MVRIESLGSFRYRVEIDRDHHTMLCEVAKRCDEYLTEVLALVIVRGLVEFDNDFLTEGK